MSTRGNRKGPNRVVTLSPETARQYRKVGQHSHRIDEYYRKVQEHNRSLADDDLGIIEISMEGFRHFLASGNING